MARLSETTDDGKKLTKTQREKMAQGEAVIEAIGDFLQKDKFSPALDNYKSIAGDILKLLDDIKNQETDPDAKFDFDSFAPYYVFFAYDRAKDKAMKIICDFIQDCALKKRQAKPTEVIRYEAYLKALNLLDMAFDIDISDLKREHFTFDETREPPLYGAQLHLCEMRDYADAYFGDFKKTIDAYKQGTKIINIKEKFRDRILELAEIYQIPFNNKEADDNILAGKIIKYFGLKENET